MKKNSLSNKLSRIENGFSVSPAYSGYIIGKFAGMPVLSGNAQACRLLPETTDSRSTSGHRTFSMLAREIVADFHPDFASGRDPNRHGDTEALCRAYFRPLYGSDPCEYRQLQQKALLYPDAREQLTRLYPPEKEIACRFLEVPLCEYREYIRSADIPDRTRDFIDKVCTAAWISDRMRLAEVWSALLCSSEETYLTVKNLYDRTPAERRDSSPFRVRRVIPLIEFFVSPIASAAKDAGRDAGERIIRNDPVNGKELNYENK